MKQEHKKLILLYSLIGILGRLLPHPANVTPLTNLCLLAGSRLPRWVALIGTLVYCVLSDIFLAFLYGYQVFSYLSLFTYSGFLLIVLLGSKLSKSHSTRRLIIYVLASSLFFWIWTNFGFWLVTPIYSKDAMGLAACYVAALPFLRNALCGDIVWMMVIFGLLPKCVENYAQKNNLIFG
jgi:hypothetical protein